MLNRIFDLAKIQQAITNFNEPVKKQYYDYLLHEFGVLFTFHSNRIEGTNNTLTLNDTKILLIIIMILHLLLIKSRKKKLMKL